MKHQAMEEMVRDVIGNTGTAPPPKLAQSAYDVVMASDPPRLVVKYERTPQGDKFEWGIVGSVPALPLVGALCRVQHHLCRDDRAEALANACPEQALVVFCANGQFGWFKHWDIPADSLCGMLESIKAQLVARQVASAAQQAAQKQARSPRLYTGADVPK